MTGVTLVSAVLLRPGTEQQYRSVHDEGVESARGLGGLIDAKLIPAIQGVQDDTVALLTFRSRADLDRWVASPDRQRILDRMQHLTDGDRRTNVLSAFGSWFPTGPATPPRWKQAIAVIIGLIPVSLALTLLRTQVAPDLSWELATVLTAIANVMALTWIVMPWLNRMLEPWLTRPR